jgi:hypothetical protein
MTTLLLFGAIWSIFVILLLLPEKPGWLGKFGANPWSVSLPSLMPEALIAATAIVMIMLLAATVCHARRGPFRLIGWVMSAWTAMMFLALHGAAPLHYISLHGASAEVGRSLHAEESSRILRTVVYHPEKDLPENIIFYGHLDYDPHSRRDRTVEFLAQQNAGTSLARIHALLAADSQLLLVTDAAGMEQVEAFSKVMIVKRHDYFIIARVGSESNPTP